MANTVTKMMASDFNKFSGGMSNFYSTLFGTPAADVARGLCEKFHDAVTYVSETEVEETDYRSVSEEYGDKDDPDKITGYTVTYHNVIPEERILEMGLDQYVNQQLEILENGVKQGLYPEGSIHRIMVDHMIDSLKLFQIREMFIDPLANKEAAWVPAGGADKKFANYVLVPKLVKKQIGQNGQEEYVYPDGFAEDNAEYFFAPREDQRDRAKYSMKELQESADKVNMNGVSKAAGTYLRTLREAEDAAVMKTPDPAQEESIRQGLLTSIRQLRQEMQKARHVDPADPVAQRMFGNILKNMNDTLFEERSYTEDIALLNQYERYLEAGLPLDGFREYRECLESMHNLLGSINQIRQETVGLENLTRAYDLVKTRLDQLPMKGATDEGRRLWKDQIREAMQEFTDAYRAIDIDNIPFREKEVPPITETDPKKREEAVKKQNKEKEATETTRNNIKNSLRTTFGDKEIPMIEGYIKTVPALGEKTIAERRKYLDGVMADMVKDMDGVAKEMERRFPPDKPISKELRDAVDKLIDAGNSDNARSPKLFESALSRVWTEATAAEMTELSEWANRHLSHYRNRMKQVESKGVLLDESLNLQRTVNLRGGRERSRKALELFNTGRAFFLKKETDNHKHVREAAEKFMEAKNQLIAMTKSGKMGTPEWEEKAREVSTLAGDVSKHAMIYIKGKNMSAHSFAGKDRMNGAIMLYREAEITRVTLKKEMAANERYRQMAQKAQQLSASVSQDPALTDPVGDANAQKMHELMKEENAREKQQKQQKQQKKRGEKQNEKDLLDNAMKSLGVDKKGLKRDALSDQPSAPKKEDGRRIKETSFEEMSRQLTLGKKKKEAVKRKVEAPVNGQAGPQPEGPVK